MNGEERICAVCRTALNAEEDLDNPGTILGWVHAEGPLTYDDIGDHEPVPVRPDVLLEARLHCDYCFERGPRWTYPAADFVIAGLDEPAGSGGNWAACGACYTLIEADEWEGLVVRAMRLNPAMKALVEAVGRARAQEALTSFYAQFRQAQTGPPFRA